MRRMDRYKEDDVKEQSRSDKNQDLYQNISTNSRYASFTDVKNANAYDISNTTSNNNTRESYHRLKEYQNIDEVKEEKVEAPKEEKEPQQEKRIYDINSFIEEARKNKKGQDELDGKRKLANTSYNILADLNKEELEKYRKEKQERINSYQESEIRELIDTIASKTLAGEIDKETSVDLLSDLMATSVMDRVEGVPEDEVTKQEEVVEEKEPTDKLDYSKEILDKEVEEIKEEEPKHKKEKKKKKKDKKNIETITGEVKTVQDADEDFYTRSMDLSDKDLDMSLEFSDSGMSIVVKLLLTILILGVIAVAGYFGYLYFFK